MAALLLTATQGACRYQQAPVQLQGAPAEIATMAGEWRGEFSSVESGRSGSIMFTVRAAGDSAFGDVLMTLAMQGGQPLIAADANTAQHLMHATSAELLRITFVHVARGEVEGRLEPYVAPDCKCVVTTTFRGTVLANGEVINGTYVTSGAQGLHQEGRWTVRRTTPAAARR